MRAIERIHIWELAHSFSVKRVYVCVCVRVGLRVCAASHPHVLSLGSCFFASTVDPRWKCDVNSNKKRTALQRNRDRMVCPNREIHCLSFSHVCAEIRSLQKGVVLKQRCFCEVSHFDKQFGSYESFPGGFTNYQSLWAIKLPRSPYWRIPIRIN